MSKAQFKKAKQEHMEFVNEKDDQTIISLDAKRQDKKNISSICHEFYVDVRNVSGNIYSFCENIESTYTMTAKEIAEHMNSRKIEDTISYINLGIELLETLKEELQAAKVK